MERTILVAEDSPTQAERLRLLLEGEGYRVDVVPNGRVGLDVVTATRPDLIISDVTMPEMDGYAFCRAVKSTEATRRIPFVLLTELRDPQNIILGLERGADNFITKPFEDEQLLERVRRIFEGLDHRRKGHLEMEVTVHVAGREIVLSADKQQIIELLFATFDDLGRMNAQLAESQRTIEEYARKLETMVEERTEQLRSLFDGVPVGLYRTSPEGRILDANLALVQMLGYPSREALLGVDVRDLYVDRAHRRDWQALIARGGILRDFETQFRRHDGTTIWVQDSARTVVDEHGRARYYEGSIQDITDRRRAAAEIQRQREALMQREKLAAMGELLAGVAHELNNPLAVVTGHTALLLRQAAGGGPLAERAEKIAKAAERCARIVKNFLALARQHPPERSRVQLNRVVEEAIELLAYQLRVHSVEVRFDPGGDLPELWADPHQLHQVVINLVSNAHDAMREMPLPRRLSLATRYDAARRRVTLAVSDTGPGISAEVRKRIFEPFFTTKPAGRGTGLGLSLCQGIVEGHGGLIQVESRSGHGTVFLVELPVEAAPAAEGPTTEPVATPSAGKAILVVDDEPEVAGVLAEMLAADGHTVETAGDGARALQKLDERHFDLVLSDIRMPDLDGPGLYREIERRHPRLLRRIVFLTGDTLSPGTTEFLALAKATSLNKPFDPDDVRRAVQRALRPA